MKKIIQQLTHFILICLVCNSCSDNVKKCDGVDNIVSVREGLSVSNNLEYSQCVSKKSKKPILLIFDNPNSTCCPKSTRLVYDLIESENLGGMFVITELCVDDKTPINPIEKVKIRNKYLYARTIGDKNTFLQINMFEVATTPYYVILDQNLKKLKGSEYFFSNLESVIDFLDVDE